MLHLLGIFDVPYSGEAYKVFKYKGGKLHSLYFPGEYSYGQEYHANIEWVSFIHEGRYLCGFHMFQKESDAKRYEKFLRNKNGPLHIIRVRYKNPVGTGYLKIERRVVPCFTSEYMSLT